jgi:hypothetical protein
MKVSGILNEVLQQAGRQDTDTRLIPKKMSYYVWLAIVDLLILSTDFKRLASPKVLEN